MDSGTIAIIGIVVALVVTLIILAICFFVYCCMRIQDDSNVRKRIIGRNNTGFAQDQVKTTLVEQQYVPPPPMPVPQPMPMPVRRQVIQEVIPAPPPPQPEVVVHEVVHRYNHPASQEIVLPAGPSRVVRRNSWTAPHNDEWVMIKKKKQQSPKVRRVEVDDSSSDEEVATKYRYGYGQPRLAAYDLAVPRPMGGAAYMVGGRPMMAAGTPVMMAPAAVSTVPVMSSSFQPLTYGVLPRM